MTIDISTAINSLNTKKNLNHEYVINGTPTNEAEYKAQVQFVESENENGIAIFSSTQPYSWSQISAEQSALQTAYDANKYQRDRAEEYPSWQDQLDMQYHDTVNSTTTWNDAIKAVKDKFPK